MSGSVVYFPTKKTTTVTLTGSGNYTVPDGVTRLDVTLYGAGGGGANNLGLQGYATGGKAGSRAIFIINVIPGQIIPYSCGTGGSPGQHGTNGGNTTFGSTNQAPGGNGGYSSIVLADTRLPNGLHGYVQGAVGGNTSNDVNSFGGGDAGVGNGGQVNVNSTTRNGGIAAGGGAGSNNSFGFGGPGIIYVTYTNSVS